jgi:uncharacterized membrane protein YebE (DUF533 family)
MNQIDITKKAVGFVVGMGVGTIVKTIIATHVAPETTVQKVTVYAGATVIGAMAKDASKSYTDDQIDQAVELFSKIKTQFADRKAQKEKQSV